MRIMQTRPLAGVLTVLALCLSMFTVVCAEDGSNDKPDTAQVASPDGQAGAAEDQADASEGEAETEGPWWESEDSLPTLRSELGEPSPEMQAEPRKWDRTLPFFAQKVIDLGFDLPQPYGVSIIGAGTSQDLVLSDLEVAIGGGDWQEIDFVSFGDPSADSISGQLKLDAWLLPFMNVYAVIGRIRGEADLTIGLDGGDLLEFLGLGDLCDLPPALRPEICGQVLEADITPEYHGTNYGVGTVLAMGWDQYFVALSLTQVWADLNLVDSKIDTFNGGVRLGQTWDRGDEGLIALFVGASYLSADMDLTGSVTLPTPGVPGLEDRTTIEYKIHQVNKNPWNYVVGTNWDINKTWNLQAEIGFGGTRNHVIASTTYRY